MLGQGSLRRAVRIPGIHAGDLHQAGENLNRVWHELSQDRSGRFADDRHPDPFGLALLVGSAAPVVLDLGATASSTAELTVHLRARPDVGWLACRARTRHIIDGYHEEDFEIWDSSGKLVAQARQLAILTSR